MKKTLLYPSTLLSTATVLIFQSCTNEDPVKITDIEGQNIIGTKVSYELEAISFQDNLEQGDNADFNFLDEIAGETMVSRQAVDITVHKDGNVEYLIEEKQPQRISLPPSSEGVPPNDIPQIVKTKASNGMVRFYDAEDNLVHKRTLDQDNNKMLLQVDRLMGNYDWIASARSEGAEVDTLSTGTLLIRRPLSIGNNQENATKRVAANGYTEELVVPDLNLLLGSSIHEPNGDLITRVMYKYDYDKDKDFWEPEMIHYEEYGTNESTGSKYIRTTNYYFDNFSIKTF